MECHSSKVHGRLMDGTCYTNQLTRIFVCGTQKDTTSQCKLINHYMFKIKYLSHFFFLSLPLSLPFFLIFPLCLV